MRQTYLVPYAHQGGHGRIFVTTEEPITAEVILEWEESIRKINGLNVGVMGFYPIFGEIGEQTHIETGTLAENISPKTTLRNG